MARVLTPLTADVWTDLGTSEMLVEIANSGAGFLMLNTAEDEDTAIRIPRFARNGDQFLNADAADTVYARPTGDGWEVIVDAF